MNDPQQPDEGSEPRRGKPGGAGRTLLWLALAAGVAGTIAVSSSNLGAAAEIPFGLVTLGCAAALIVHHYRYRR
ncbi:hypothetical protein [Amycolatopsis samaneae]|uniref:Uncharacterized protein n=1 Tax=Amycolatopsis samaneae TaxID=664691 RepID=A0ABW5GCY0_9PSEU